MQTLSLPRIMRHIRTAMSLNLLAANHADYQGKPMMYRYPDGCGSAIGVALSQETVDNLIAQGRNTSSLYDLINYKFIAIGGKSTDSGIVLEIDTRYTSWHKAAPALIPARREQFLDYLTRVDKYLEQCKP